MSGQGTAGATAQRPGSAITRLARAWRSLPADRQLAAAAAVGLCLTLFLPWDQETGFVRGRKVPQAAAVSLTGWHAFSWVEAALLLVAFSVLALLLLRAEGRAFHLPGGDGFIVMAAGVWTSLLLIWRTFDKQWTTSSHQFGTTFGIKWGIFAALGIAVLLAYAGTRIRAAHQPEPPLPGEEPGGGPPRRRAAPGTRRAAREAPARAVRAAVAADGPEARRSERAKVARRATWAEPVTWEAATEPVEPQLTFAPGDPAYGLGASDSAGADDDRAEETQPLRLVDPTEATEPLRLVDPIEDEKPD
ncbi:MAG TPA: hypothetical protein VGH24_09580 [Solirubrobacteraceae bacterium]